MAPAERLFVKMVLFSLTCFLCCGGSEGASCPFTQSVSPICQPLFQPPRSHHSLCATVNRLPILSHTGHMSLERIYYTISSFRKSCKEASQGDKSPQSEEQLYLTEPKENPPIGTLSVSVVLSIELRVVL